MDKFNDIADTASNDIENVDSFFAGVNFKPLDTLKVGLWGTYMGGDPNENDPADFGNIDPRDYEIKNFADDVKLDLFTMGTDGSYDFGNFFINWNLIYQTGKIKDANFLSVTPGTDRNSGAVLSSGDFDVNAYLLHADLGYKFGKAKLTYTFWYASGDDNPKDDDFDAFLAVDGSIFTLNGKNLTPVAEKIPRILGTFDLNGDQRPEMLLSQRFDGENFFGDGVKELKLIKGKIKFFKPAITLPRRFTVLGSLFADLTGDGQLETVFIRGSILYIYNKKNRLYASPKEMGGSLSFLTYEIDPTAKEIQPTSASFEVSPVAADLDGDGQLEILAVASERNIIGDVAAGPGIRKSWLEVVKFKDGRFVKGTLGEEMDTPLQGLVVADKRVLFVVTQPGNLFGKGRNSHLLAYQLDL